MFRLLARFAALPLALLAGCGMIPPKEVTLRVPISVHSDTEATVSGGDQADLRKLAEYEDVKAVLSKVTLKSVAFRVKSIGGQNTATSATGKLTLTSKGTTLDVGVYSVGITAGTSVDVTFEQAAADKLAEIAMSAEPVFDVTAAGSVDAVPAYFEAEAIFVVELEAGLKI